MNICIVEGQKLLIWSENTYKQKKKPEWKGEGRSGDWGVEKENERKSEQICSLLLSDLFSEKKFL